MSPRKTSPEDAQKIAAHALRLPCRECGAGPGTPCTEPGRVRSVCKPRYIAAAIEVTKQAKVARQTPEQAAILASLPRLTLAEVEAGRSPAGGYTREQLAKWGVPWPPPAGWRQALLRAEDTPASHGGTTT